MFINDLICHVRKESLFKKFYVGEKVRNTYPHIDRAIGHINFFGNTYKVSLEKLYKADPYFCLPHSHFAPFECKLLCGEYSEVLYYDWEQIGHSTYTDGAIHGLNSIRTQHKIIPAENSYRVRLDYNRYDVFSNTMYNSFPELSRSEVTDLVGKFVLLV